MGSIQSQVTALTTYVLDPVLGGRFCVGSFTIGLIQSQFTALTTCVWDPVLLGRFCAGSFNMGSIHSQIAPLTNHTTRNFCVGSFTMGSTMCGILYYGAELCVGGRKQLPTGSQLQTSLSCGIL